MNNYSFYRCSNIDELAGPLRLHLAPKLSDALLIGVLVGASKRLEAAIRRVRNGYTHTLFQLDS